MWYDESFVALNVLHKGAGALLGALEWDESAPPGFLIVERFTTAAAGRSEYAFRLVPLLAGLATVICFAFTARRICGNGPAWLWSVLMLAASTKLIVHAATLKHFTLDTLATVLIVWSALKVRTNGNNLVWILAWGILGAAGIWLSFASLFSFAGTSVVLLVAAVCARRPREIAPLAAANLLVLISLLTLADPIRAQLGTHGLLGYWSRAGAFPPTNSLPGLGWWLAVSITGFSGYFWRWPGVVMLTLAIVGAGALWRSQRRSEMLMLLLPIGFALMASGLRRWPFGNNPHMVFAAPLLFVLVATGAEAIHVRVNSWRPWAGAVAITLLLTPGLLHAARGAVHPEYKHQLGPVFDFVRRNARPADQFIVIDLATCEFYLEGDRRCRPHAVQPGERVWFVSIQSGSNRASLTGRDSLERLKRHRSVLLVYEPYGAACYLFAREEG